EREGSADGRARDVLTGCASLGVPVERPDVVELVSSLVDKSMVSCAAPERLHTARGSEAPTPACFRLLETVRQYAAERLRESGDEGALDRRHYRYFLRLAE